MNCFKTFLIVFMTCFMFYSVAAISCSVYVAEFDDLKEAQEIEKLLSENDVRSFGIEESKKTVFYVEKSIYEKLKNSDIFNFMENPGYVKKENEDCSLANYVRFAGGTPHKKLGDDWVRFAVFTITSYANGNDQKTKLNEFMRKFSDNYIPFMIEFEPAKYIVCIDSISMYQAYYILRKNNKNFKMLEDMLLAF